MVRSEKPRDEFMERVQAHERNWGNETYPNRPDLIEIISAPIVAFWQPSDPNITHQIITLHTDLKEIEQWFIQVFLRAHITQPDRRFLAAYSNRKKVRIKGVSIQFEVEGE